VFSNRILFKIDLSYLLLTDQDQTLQTVVGSND